MPYWHGKMPVYRNYKVFSPNLYTRCFTQQCSIADQKTTLEVVSYLLLKLSGNPSKIWNFSISKSIYNWILCHFESSLVHRNVMYVLWPFEKKCWVSIRAAAPKCAATVYIFPLYNNFYFRLLLIAPIFEGLNFVKVG